MVVVKQQLVFLLIVLGVLSPPVLASVGNDATGHGRGGAIAGGSPIGPLAVRRLQKAAKNGGKAAVGARKEDLSSKREKEGTIRSAHLKRFLNTSRVMKKGGAFALGSEDEAKDLQQAFSAVDAKVNEEAQAQTDEAMATLDRDRDNSLTEDELREGFDFQSREILEKLDRNADGTLSKEGMQRGFVRLGRVHTVAKQQEGVDAKKKESAKLREKVKGDSVEHQAAWIR